MRLEIAAWYHGLNIDDVERWWLAHLDQMGPAVVSSSDSEWGRVTWKGEVVYFSVTRRVGNHVAVELMVENSLPEEMLSFTEKLISLAPDEVRPIEILILRNTVTEAAGPLLCLNLQKRGILYCIRGIAHNSLFDERHLRLVHRSLFPDLERLLLTAAPRYTQRSWIAGDYIWLDFHWFNPGFTPDLSANPRPFGRAIYSATSE